MVKVLSELAIHPLRVIDIHKISSKYHNQQGTNNISSVQNGRILASECLIDPITTVRFNFDRDILAFVHIQKTGGTEFSSILVHNIQVNPGCSCRTPNDTNHQLIICLCERPNIKSWEKIINNITEYSGTKRNTILRYFVTMLREPMKRYLSEYYQILKGSHWRRQYILCEKEVLIVRPTCFAHIKKISELTLEDLSTEQKNHIMLESAKINLQLGLKVFGITEFMPETIYLFEKVLGISFSNKELLKNKVSKSEEGSKRLDRDMLIKIAQNNHLDVKLYNFAIKLFRERLAKFGYYQRMSYEKNKNKSLS
ncbi:heparan-sulfate 6-O-sulfotransferase 2-like [Gordionus sp. m RMFG-2023]|uniref:heparan-sulfate 6-O-sulfotransferase 2-like n=1 Tax=Gordionus sp. m RMFG-2023 TaxID=3053472 RepID=UPI0031FC7316